MWIFLHINLIKFIFFISASLLISLDAAVLLERVKRQFGGFVPFGPTGPPPPLGGPFGGPGIVRGNFPGFGPPGPQRNFRPQGQGGLTIPAGSGNIIPRQVGGRQQQQPQQQQQQQQPNRNSPSYRQCLANCPTTNEYNPVCGSDQQDYFNEQRLQCANRCGMSMGYSISFLKKALLNSYLFQVFQQFGEGHAIIESSP